jgi:hypothetical protein
MGAGVVACEARAHILDDPSSCADEPGMNCNRSLALEGPPRWRLGMNGPPTARTKNVDRRSGAVHFGVSIAGPSPISEATAGRGFSAKDAAATLDDRDASPIK